MTTARTNMDARHSAAIPRRHSFRGPALALATCAASGLMLATTANPVQAGGPLILIDVDTGRVLYSERAEQRWHPASLTKIMTAYLTFRAIKDGRLSLDSKLVTSETAHAMPPSKIGLPIGAEMSVELGLQSLIIKSANDVAVMLAEAIDGSVEAFAQRMNRTALSLGMSRTVFLNPNGLPVREQVTTAADLARLTRAVLSEHPEYAHYWATPTMRIGKIRLRSHNSLLQSYPGTTGLKTGFICDSGFNIVASAKRDGHHLAAVVLGETSPQDREARAAGLLDHGFEMYAWKLFLKAPTLSGLPRPTDNDEAPSIRGDIKVWDCRGPRAPGRESGEAAPDELAGAQ